MVVNRLLLPCALVRLTTWQSSLHVKTAPQHSLHPPGSSSPPSLPSLLLPDTPRVSSFHHFPVSFAKRRSSLLERHSAMMDRRNMCDGPTQHPSSTLMAAEAAGQAGCNQQEINADFPPFGGWARCPVLARVDPRSTQTAKTSHAALGVAITEATVPTY